MLRHTIIPLLALAGATAAQARTPDPSLARQEGVLQWVDTRIGTSGHGHTFMGAAAPFGAVQLGPTNFNKGCDWCSGYHDSDSICVGFAHLHLNGTGCSDTGDLLFMPTAGEIRVTPGSQENPDSGYASRYSHQREATAPAYYRLHLDDYGSDVELTATERVGLHRYTFPGEGQKQVVINLFDANGDDRATETFIEQQDNHTVRGYRCSSGGSKQQRIYFTARFSEPVTLEIYKDDKLAAGSSIERGINLKGVARRDDSAREVLGKVGISPVSMAGAARNIDCELPGWDFAATVRATSRKWERELGKVAVKGSDDAARRLLYTGLYHAFLQPNLFNDCDGAYRGADGKNHETPGHETYTVFS